VSNEKAFTTYVILLAAGVTSLLWTMVATGVAAWPSPFTFLEHASLGLMFRGAYKFIGGLDWADWSILPEHATVPADRGIPDTGAEAHA
jgi:hypothetical protein